MEPSTFIAARKSQAGKGHSGSQAEGREVTTTTKNHSSMPDAIWLPGGERELETDWLTPLGSSFFENLYSCILFSPLPLSPVCPSRTSLLCAPLIDGFCFQWGFQRQFPGTSCLCTTTLLPQVPGTLMLSPSSVTPTTWTWPPLTHIIPTSA